jgi:hypothetical protein
MRRIADEHIGLLTVISLTQEQLEEIGSDKLPSFQWDLVVYFVSMMFMLTQVVPESLTLHLESNEPQMGISIKISHDPINGFTLNEGINLSLI